LIPTSFHP